MDSKIVTREIRREIWPALRQHGFDSFSSRTAWRHLPHRIDLVNFQSFNSYFALVDGCTTFSFAVNLGAYFPAIPPKRPSLQNVEKPRDFDCHFRGGLFKKLHQPGYARKNIWYVDHEGLNVLDVLADARSVLISAGLPWFDRFGSLHDVLRILLEDDESDSLFGMGVRWSSRRKWLIGHVARATGNEEVAAQLLNEAEAEMRSIRRRIESISRNRRAPKSD